MKTLNNTNQDICYIEYLNAKKGFRMDHVKFTGENAYDDAEKWGRANLKNFNLDMIRSKLFHSL